eukprot:s2438_g10.t1
MERLITSSPSESGKPHALTQSTPLGSLLVVLAGAPSNLLCAETRPRPSGSKKSIGMADTPRTVTPEECCGEVWWDEVCHGEVLSGEVRCGEVLAGEMWFCEVWCDEVWPGEEWCVNDMEKKLVRLDRRR